MMVVVNTLRMLTRTDDDLWKMMKKVFVCWCLTEVHHQLLFAIGREDMSNNNIIMIYLKKKKKS